MEPLIIEILEDLTTELGLKKDSDIAVLTSKVKNAYREVKRTRNYQSYIRKSLLTRIWRISIPISENLRYMTITKLV